MELRSVSVVPHLEARLVTVIENASVMQVIAELGVWLPPMNAVLYFEDRIEKSTVEVVHASPLYCIASAFNESP
jgi:TRAP-type C4-dicarboxylate transport system permease large subunit